MTTFAGMNIQMVLTYTDLHRRSGQFNDVLLLRLKATLIWLVANDVIRWHEYSYDSNVHRIGQEKWSV